MKSFYSITSIVKASVLIIFSMVASQAVAHRFEINRIVSFGASLSDSGNSYYWLSLPENQACGKINVPPFFVLDPLLVPNGPYFIDGQYHFSNGQTWLEGFARYLALARSAQPAFSNDNKKLTNYSVGGARAVANKPCRVNLTDQVQNYFADYSRTSPNTLITLEIGGNDIRDALFAAAEGQDPGPYIQGAIESIGHTLSALYMHGARKFLVLNVPDLGKTPAVRMIPGASQIATKLTEAFNQNLLLALKGINKLPGNKVKLLDIKGKLDDVVKHAADYGFANVTDACVKPNQNPYQCINPDSYLFWDGIHPTEAMHDIVAQQAVITVKSRW
ncbi:MAG: SGNH/GDSL hydrolase family protein [Methyloglobulus sp.]|nr:SGNH/GDSL hydrolase family protein [Methyloglobulus sp.]